MTVIQRNALVSYTPRQMFELVNHIEEYPRFLPWCSESTVLYRDAEFVEARLNIAWSGIHKSFTTRNQLHPFNRIDIVLVEGPFRHLAGYWSFLELGEEGCKINLELEFEFSMSIFDRIFQPIFSHIANSLVDAFCKRAVEVYGGC